MKLKLIQCSVGNYNWCDSSQKFLVFACSLVDDEGKIIEVDGKKCKLDFSDKDCQNTHQYLDDFEAGNLQNIFDQSESYASKVLSSTDYKGQNAAFKKIYTENYEEINRHWMMENTEAVRKEIERLEKRLNYQLDELE